MPLKFSYGKLTFEEVREFLLETDKEFPTPLSTHVDIDVYAKKLSDFSDFSICRDGDDIVGMISCYTNQPPIGYISNVCIKKRYQGKSIFSSMFSLLTVHMKEKEIDVLRLEVDSLNEKAKSIYFRQGFRILDVRSDTNKLFLELTIDDRKRKSDEETIY